MNFVGHIKVAVGQLTDDRVPGRTEILIGAVLPDVAAMGRFRLSKPADDQDVRSGVAMHHLTDDAFHGHGWFRQHSSAVTAGLAELGLRRGAARACGHVGVELLLDGFLLDSDDELSSTTHLAMSAVTLPALGLSKMVDSERAVDWQQHLQRTAGWPVPSDYRDPEAVAERLRRILARRPRLCFDTDQTARVASVLADRQPMLEQGVDVLLADLRRDVSIRSSVSAETS